jgi:Zn-finger nucleic acid-binding protein
MLAQVWTNVNLDYCSKCEQNLDDKAQFEKIF